MGNAVCGSEEEFIVGLAALHEDQEDHGNQDDHEDQEEQVMNKNSDKETNEKSSDDEMPNLIK